MRHAGTPSAFRRRGFAAVLALAAGAAHAAKLELKLDGVEDDLRSAVLAGLEIDQYANRDVTAAQARRLYAAAPGQVAAALEAYGYYDTHVDGELTETPAGWQAVVHVKPGEPVNVAALDLDLTGPAREEKRVRIALAAFAPRVGDRLDHAAYERGKTAIQAALLATGYLDAELKTHRVDVRRETRKAEIHLAWVPGQRYRIGPVTFEGAQFGDEFLQRYVPWHEGDYYTQESMLSLQQRLVDADYFAIADVSPDVEKAHDGIVPIVVHLGPAKRSIYTGGVFVGTDTGFGVRGGLERRWVNRQGHKFKTEAVVAQRLKTLAALYTIPLPGPNDRSYNFGANFKDENTTTSKSRTANFVANETRQWMGFTRTVGVHLLTGDFEVAGTNGNSTMLYPEIDLTRKRADDPLFVREGYSLNLLARAAKADLLSDTDFVQVRADAKWIHGFGKRQRLIVRGSAGATWVNDFNQLPPDLRFFTGGDRSIRGYGYQEVGPRATNPKTGDQDVIGGRNLIVGSAEYEYYFSRKWGVATFVDAGDAFSGTQFKLKTGVGAGVRWRSPVGMVRFDLGVPVGDKDARHQVTIHLVIGPDL